ncbi:SocA family protein [Nocardia higoensis]|uniref:SocA family protein n=1 Tax=Nocardia higoensis TaxID=228599 RepID=A0ABS0DIB8_9NOCA|nr:Panacea domain-containing protein [Nocardia higoensis]MBF6358207.1 SocA family protein [Nocardia higoensis]
MATALDVAGYIYRQCGWVDAWKLEKLLYFSQAWHLAWDGRPMFEDKFQAWIDGPVQPTVFRVNKYDRAGQWSTELPGADPDALHPQAAAVVNAVLGFYAELSKTDLVELSHEQPWRIARGPLPDDVPGNAEMSNTEIKRWYTSKVLRGEKDIPAQPAVQLTEIPHDVFMQAAALEMERWKETLRLLADR